MSFGIDCQGKNPNCFPIYKFSNDPQTLEEIDLDSSNLVKLKNKNKEKWNKYLLFVLDDKNTSTAIGHGQGNPELFKKPNNWKEMWVSDVSSDPKDKNKNYLNLWLGEEGNYSAMTKHHEFDLKIINFLTPSFKLGTINVVDEEEGGTEDNDDEEDMEDIEEHDDEE